MVKGGNFTDTAFILKYDYTRGHHCNEQTTLLEEARFKNDFIPTLNANCSREDVDFTDQLAMA